MSDKRKIDPLLEFFCNLLQDETEKEIISKIFKNFSEEEIIESLIEYSEKKENNA